MSAGGARRGRRDNGLDAAEYVAAGDVDPRIGEHLLDILGAAGIAAYLQPSADLHPITRTTTVPARPTDRLYVDRAHLSTAREYVAQLAEDARSGPAAQPGGTRPGADPDVDAEWAKIIAGYHTETAPEAPPWPAAEDVEADDDPDAGSARSSLDSGATDPADAGPRRLSSAADFSGISVSGHVDSPSLLDGLDTFGAHLPDDDEGYTPPPPPPLPRLSKYAVVAVAAIVCGFALFIFPALLPVSHLLATVAGFLGIVGGFVTLVWRLRPGDEDDDYDPDDGAVV